MRAVWLILEVKKEEYKQTAKSTASLILPRALNHVFVTGAPLLFAYVFFLFIAASG
jgi:hypothetical protein